MEKIRILDPRSGIHNKHPKSNFPRAFKRLKMLKFFVADPALGSGAFLTPDPESEFEKLE
jgi:hypothetical protein